MSNNAKDKVTQQTMTRSCPRLISGGNEPGVDKADITVLSSRPEEIEER